MWQSNVFSVDSFIKLSDQQGEMNGMELLNPLKWGQNIGMLFPKTYYSVTTWTTNHVVILKLLNFIIGQSCLMLSAQSYSETYSQNSKKENKHLKLYLSL